MFNSDQTAHMDALAKYPEKVCGCGWYWKDECQSICHNRSKQTPEDKALYDAYHRGREFERNRVERLAKKLIDNWYSQTVDTNGKERTDNRAGRFAIQAIVRDVNDLKNY